MFQENREADYGNTSGRVNTNYNNKEGRIELPFKNNKNNNNDDSDKYSSSTSTVNQRPISSSSTQLFRRFLRTSKNDFQEDSTSRIRADTVISNQAIQLILILVGQCGSLYYDVPLTLSLYIMSSLCVKRKYDHFLNPN